MKIDFKPQRLLSSLVTEEKIPGGVRRILQTEGPKARTIDMELSHLDSLGNAYPKEYYVSSVKVYDTKSSNLLKMVQREVVGTTNSVTNLVTRNYDGKYNKSMIIRNNDSITKQ